MMPQESESTSRQPSGLLGAVLSDPQLRRKFGEMSTDEKTISLANGDSPETSPSGWTANEIDSTGIETIEVSPDALPSNNRPTDKGFVPQRHLALLGDEKLEDTEYRIVGRLGSGGTSIVYQAHQRAIDREVAIKVLRDELTYSEVSRERFLAEARMIGGLDHPNVIALHEVGVDHAGGLFYSMKRIDGTSWDNRIAEMSLGGNINTLLSVADAIRYAHSRALIHRDIKPENVMLGKFGEVLLADWGLALSLGSDKFKSGTNSIGGTPAYMSPELAGGQLSAIGFQTDVYLLGAVLFQILTGDPPHHGANVLACIHAAAHNVIRETDIEGELMDIAAKAMAMDPADRYESVEMFIKAIVDQRQHDESARLVRRACDRLASASNAHRYEDFRVADALLVEALEVWPENARAIKVQQKLHQQFAEIATERGDLDLAISIYEGAGQAESEQAVRVRDMLRRRAASQQRVSRYSALFTQSPDAGLLIQISTGRVVEVNQAFAKLFGYSEDEVVGRPLAELNLWACPEQRSKLTDELRRSGEIDQFEAAFLHSDGHAIQVLISGKVLEVLGEEMVVSTIRDISLRKQAENELKKSRHRLRDLQRLAGLATWSYDVRSETVSWSEEVFQLSGRRVEDGVPTREEYWEMLHPEDRPKMKETLDAALESGAAYELLVRQRGKGGQYKKLIVRGQPIFDDDGNTIEVYGVLIPQRT
jgi:PAS domain S-box-containing protein